MSDYGKSVALNYSNQQFLANSSGSIASNVSITNGSTAATLASIPAGLVHATTYKIVATGIPGGTTFNFKNSTAITLSQAATATNGTAASNISPA